MQKQEFIMKYHSPLGVMTVSSDGENISGLWLEGQKYFIATLGEHQLGENPDLPVFSQVKHWLDSYFRGENPRISFGLAPKGSFFRKKIFKQMLDIPYGSVTTYGEIARKIVPEGAKALSYSQAVGSAVAHNPISVIIPCHRVVGSGGSLTGYAGGLENKIKLLKLEQVDLSPFFIPKKGTAL